MTEKLEIATPLDRAKMALRGMSWTPAEALELKVLVDQGIRWDVAHLDDIRDKRKWEQSNSPADYTPLDMAKSLVRDITSGHLDAKHIIAFWVTQDLVEGTERVSFRQAGSDTRRETIGTVERGKMSLMGFEQ